MDYWQHAGKSELLNNCILFGLIGAVISFIYTGAVIKLRSLIETRMAALLPMRRGSPNSSSCWQRNPCANRSLIALTAWSSFAHAAIMTLQALRTLIPRRELVGVPFFVIIGIALIALAPVKPSGEQPSGAVA